MSLNPLVIAFLLMVSPWCVNHAIADSGYPGLTHPIVGIWESTDRANSFVAVLEFKESGEATYYMIVALENAYEVDTENGLLYEGECHDNCDDRKGTPFELVDGELALTTIDGTIRHRTPHPPTAVRNSIVGTWTYKHHITHLPAYERYLPDGINLFRLQMPGNQELQYHLQGNQLHIVSEQGDQSQRFEIEGDRLTLYNEDSRREYIFLRVDWYPLMSNEYIKNQLKLEGVVDDEALPANNEPQ